MEYGLAYVLLKILGVCADALQGPAVDDDAVGEDIAIPEPPILLGNSMVEAKQFLPVFFPFLRPWGGFVLDDESYIFQPASQFRGQ